MRHGPRGRSARPGPRARCRGTRGLIQPPGLVAGPVVLSQGVDSTPECMEVLGTVRSANQTGKRNPEISHRNPQPRGSLELLAAAVAAELLSYFEKS